ncbi:hypothetical protein [Ralstonia pseudosolanacearum]|uniref:hypothetical protein n=1 Tax=Ralstonia pseudosolanacearum TaxID=1310165 RepID=UPI003CF64C83
MMGPTETPNRPLKPDTEVLALAQAILGKRFEANHKDGNALLAAVRERNLPIVFAYFGPRAIDARRVIDEVADQNLRAAPAARIQRRIDCIQGKIHASIATSIAKFDPTRLGGSGAAGRQRDRARASEVRNILAIEAGRLQAELARRASSAPELHPTY